MMRSNSSRADHLLTAAQALQLGDVGHALTEDI
jgi:hypothetical protein